MIIDLCHSNGGSQCDEKSKDKGRVFTINKPKLFKRDSICMKEFGLMFQILIIDYLKTKTNVTIFSEMTIQRGRSLCTYVQIEQLEEKNPTQPLLPKKLNAQEQWRPNP